MYTQAVMSQAREGRTIARPQLSQADPTPLLQADIVRFPPNVSMTKRGLAKMTLSERSPIVSPF